jgi:hypothetical protein
MECQDVQAVPPPFSPGAPQFAPHASNRLPFTNLTPAVPSHLIVGLDHASVRGARRLLRSLAGVGCSPSSSLAVPTRPVSLAPVMAPVMAPDFCLIRWALSR